MCSVPVCYLLLRSGEGSRASLKLGWICKSRHRGRQNFERKQEVGSRDYCEISASLMEFGVELSGVFGGPRMCRQLEGSVSILKGLGAETGSMQLPIAPFPL